MVVMLRLISSATALCSSVAAAIWGGHLGDVGHRFADADQRLVGLKHPGHAFLRLALAVAPCFVQRCWTMPGAW